MMEYVALVLQAISADIVDQEERTADNSTIGVDNEEEQEEEDCCDVLYDAAGDTNYACELDHSLMRLLENKKQFNTLHQIAFRFIYDSECFWFFAGIDNAECPLSDKNDESIQRNLEEATSSDDHLFVLPVCDAETIPLDPSSVEQENCVDEKVQTTTEEGHDTDLANGGISPVSLS